MLWVTIVGGAFYYSLSLNLKIVETSETEPSSGMPLDRDYGEASLSIRFYMPISGTFALIFTVVWPRLTTFIVCFRWSSVIA